MLLSPTYPSPPPTTHTYDPPEVEGQARPTQRHDRCTCHLRHPPSTDTRRSCDNLTDESIIAIANRCSKLAQLYVS